MHVVCTTSTPDKCPLVLSVQLWNCNTKLSSLCIISAMRLQPDGPVHVSLKISCRHRGHHVAAKQKAHLPLVSAGFALRLGSALDGATKPLVLIALHERSVLSLTCSDARSEEFSAVSIRCRDDIHHKLRTQQAIMRADRPMQNAVLRMQ